MNITILPIGMLKTYSSKTLHDALNGLIGKKKAAQREVDAALNNWDMI